MPDKSSGSIYLAEPSGQHLRYPPLVVDCSVLASVLFDEPGREEALLTMSGKELFAPDLLNHEMVSVCLKKAKAGMQDAALQALQDLVDLRLTRCAVNCTAQFDLAKQLKLTAYDAAYLQLALALNAPLVTFDQKLGAAARQVLSKA